MGLNRVMIMGNGGSIGLGERAKPRIVIIERANFVRRARTARTGCHMQEIRVCHITLPESKPYQQKARIPETVAHSSSAGNGHGEGRKGCTVKGVTITTTTNKSTAIKDDKIITMGMRSTATMIAMAITSNSSNTIAITIKSRNTNIEGSNVLLMYTITIRMK